MCETTRMRVKNKRTRNPHTTANYTLSPVSNEFWVIHWIRLPTHRLNYNTAFITQDLQLRRMPQYSLVLQHKIRKSGRLLWTRNESSGPLKCGTFLEYAIWRTVSLLIKTDLYGVTWLVTVTTRISASPVIKNSIPPAISILCTQTGSQYKNRASAWLNLH